MKQVRPKFLFLLMCLMCSVVYGGTNPLYSKDWQVSNVADPVFGSKLHIVEAGQHHEQTVILVHGLGQNGVKDWLNTIPLLEKSFHVIGFDLPGFGQSPVAQGLFSPSNYSRLIHWITKNYAKGKVIVIGHSLGGAISLRYTHDYEDEVKQLVLVDAAGILHRTVFTKHLARFSNTVPSQSIVYGWLSNITRRVDSISEDLLSMADAIPDVSRYILHNKSAREYLFQDRQTANAALALISEDFSRAIAEVAVPTFIIWGDKDKVAPLRTGKLLAGRMRNASLAVLHRVGHVPMNETPALFNDVLKGYLLAGELGQQIKLPAEEKVLSDYSCNGSQNDVIQGAYQHINITNCQYVKLQNVFAQSISIKSSRVELENVNVVAKQTALSVSDSNLEGTLIRLEGEVPLDAEESRIDLAGVSLVTESIRDFNIAASKVYFSVSDITSAGKKRIVHELVEN